MSLLGWLGPADVVSWNPGDDSGVGDAGTVLSDCYAGTSDFDDCPADGAAGLVLKDDGVSGADIQVAVALVAGVGVVVLGTAGLRVCRVGLRSPSVLNGHWMA